MFMSRGDDALHGLPVVVACEGWSPFAWTYSEIVYSDGRVSPGPEVLRTGEERRTGRESIVLGTAYR